MLTVRMTEEEWLEHFKAMEQIKKRHLELNVLDVIAKV